jgi:hypothetical protein
MICAISSTEAVQRFTVYLNIWMFVVGMLEFSVESCAQQDLLNSVSHWDQAVTFYTGSLEGPDGSGNGNLLYHLADQLCVEFDNCNEDGSSAVNHNVFKEFKSGQSNVAKGGCSAAEANKNRIVAFLSVPMIQGVLLYTAKSNKDERDQTAGFTFASAILPLMYDCNKEKASIIYDTLRIPLAPGGDTTTALPMVTAAFEENYECLGITCEDVGDLVGAELCGSPTPGKVEPLQTQDDPETKDDDPDEVNSAESISLMVMPRWISLAAPIFGSILLLK